MYTPTSARSVAHQMSNQYTGGFNFQLFFVKFLLRLLLHFILVPPHPFLQHYSCSCCFSISAVAAIVVGKVRLKTFRHDAKRFLAFPHCQAETRLLNNVDVTVPSLPSAPTLELHFSHWLQICVLSSYFIRFRALTTHFNWFAL